MKKTNKRIIILTFSIIFLIVAVIAGIRYLPLNKILKVSSTPETEFINSPQITPQAPNALFFDFEIDPATGNNNGLYQGIAHSGQFSAKAFGKNSYSIAIDRTAGQVGTDNLKAVGLSAWVYVFPTDQEVQGSYVFSVNNDLGVNICWKSVGVAGEHIPKGEWFKISGMFDLTGIGWKPEYKIQVYFWNNSSTDILVDDYYIVFGGPKERRGDSSLFDMTSGKPFLPRFNYPPFPVSYFEKQETGNQDSPFIINDGDARAGNISPLAKIYAGRFTQNPDGCDDLLMIGPDKKVEMFHFCNERNRFLPVSFFSPPDLLTYSSAGVILQGSFTSATGEQLVILRDGHLHLVSFDKVKGSCNGNDLNTTFSVRPADLGKDLSAILMPPGIRFLTADLDNDGITEILSIGEKGSWTIIKYELNSNRWKILASDIVNPADQVNPVPEWMDADFTFTVSAGKFISYFPQDQLLTVFSSRKGGNKGYSTRRFDAAKKQLVPVFPGKQFAGKTIGLDTLSPEDQFFSGYFDHSGARKIFRYNREWRYDLKEIVFNDTTFHIISNMDFKGYEKDHNPKYYGILKIIQGNFTDRKEASLLMIGRNCKVNGNESKECDAFEDLPFLPDFAGLYKYGKYVQ